MNKIDFMALAGTKACLWKRNISSCVDKEGYVVGSVRHKLRAGKAPLLAPKAEDADAVMELRSGAVGTDVTSSYLGIPGFTAPGMIGIPDIKIVTHDSQRAVAKI